jgi:hypothetical protein
MVTTVVLTLAQLVDDPLKYPRCAAATTPIRSQTRTKPANTLIAGLGLDRLDHAITQVYHTGRGPMHVRS